MKTCKCSVYDAYGYHALGGPGLTFAGGFSILEAKMVPSVYARYIFDNHNVRAGEMPPAEFNPHWSVSIPVHRDSPLASEDPEHHGRYIGAVLATKHFTEGGKNYVAYFLSEENNNNPPDEEKLLLDAICIIDVEKQEVYRIFYPPREEPVDLPNENTYAYQTGTASLRGTSGLFRANAHGIHKDHWIVVAGPGDGASLAARHDMAVPYSGIGFASNSTYGALHVIQVPCQLSDDGLPWVATLHNDSKDIHVGVWTNTSLGTPTTPFATSAALDVGELVMRLDDKPGFPPDSAGNPILLTAYTRCGDKNYVVGHHDEFVSGEGTSTHYYFYDGLKNRWFEAGGPVTNIYAMPDGSVVLASDTYLQYIGADGEQWEHRFWETADTYGSVPNISSNKNWIHVSGMLAIQYHTFTLATAPINKYGTHIWESYYTGDLTFAANSWAFSKKSDGAGAPKVLVPLREYDVGGMQAYWFWDTLEITDPSTVPGPPTPYIDGEAVYISRRYTTSDIIHHVDSQSGQFYMAGRNTSYAAQRECYPFDAVPSSFCCDSNVPDYVETGY